MLGEGQKYSVGKVRNHSAGKSTVHSSLKSFRYDDNCLSKKSFASSLGSFLFVVHKEVFFQ